MRRELPCQLKSSRQLERPQVFVDAIGVREAGEPAGDPPHEAIEDCEHLGVGGDGQELEPQAVRLVVDEDAIGHDEVEMDVEVHQPAEALHEGDCAGARRGEAALASDASLPGANGAGVDGGLIPSTDRRESRGLEDLAVTICVRTDTEKIEGLGCQSETLSRWTPALS